MRMKDLSRGMANETPDRRWISATPSHVFWISKGKELESLSASTTHQSIDRKITIRREERRRREEESRRSRPRRRAAKFRQKGRFPNALLPDRTHNEKVAVLWAELLLVVTQDRIEMSVEKESIDMFAFSSSFSGLIAWTTTFCAAVDLGGGCFAGAACTGCA